MHSTLLFLVYINVIVNSTDFGKLIMFADDTNIFIADKDINDVYRKANKVLKCVCEYMKLNYSAGKRDRGKRHPREEGAKPPDSIEQGAKPPVR